MMTHSTRTSALASDRTACEAAIAGLRNSLDTAECSTTPFRHWTLSDILPQEACDALVAWEPEDNAVAGDTGGRRETRNGSRVFVEPEARARDARLDVLAHMFDSPEGRAAVEALCGTKLDHTALRLELSLDTDGFWLEPHTDIGAKKLTLLIPLSVHEDAEQWGTDLMNAEGNTVVRSSGRFNTGTLFVPGDDTWHGFQKRPINGLRRGLIVNFVDSSWRATHELAFGPAQ
ncbi:2OG-Fe(II) oxygenase [Acetobacter sicerae]|uniref:2OG-Fe(II) oxygenase n=1 Tax=Acetobacter sicerae TaxID=85325 RepID=A0ABS8VUA8_9PROT|nr:2OG-Fe(II) oxygenase [Acetobacter sicerae]MCE0744255.1 2OG-Fe(II) oxygenase [Acetobacter sicerae]NHN92205.1 2OG-Fe(II) oxygenase [Acetobacter sicerae]